jgi:molybdopterin molybdotransferase
MLSAHRALESILSSVTVGEAEVVHLQHAHGRILAEEIIAGEDIPPFDNSGMDGFALRAEDIAQAPTLLRLVGEVSAGNVLSRRVGQGEAVGITTGGQIPPGADAIIQIEWTESVDGTSVRVMRSIPPGHNIRRAGEDIHRGEKIFEKGRRLRAAELGVLASLGRTQVQVYRVPHVAVLATGNELVEIDQAPQQVKIRNSNSSTLLALLQETNSLPVDLGIAGDDRTKLREKIIKGLELDALITAGGVSVGSYDFVQEVLRDLGVEIRFWKVNIKPGMPLLFGVYKEKPPKGPVKPVFGLPGNPVSAFVTFTKFVRPALRKMMGENSSEKELSLEARLEHEIKTTDGKRHFMRGVLESRGGVLTVRTTGSQASNLLTSLAKANCLVIVPETVSLLRKGDLVKVELL